MDQLCERILISRDSGSTLLEAPRYRRRHGCETIAAGFAMAGCSFPESARRRSEMVQGRETAAFWAVVDLLREEDDQTRDGPPIARWKGGVGLKVVRT